MSGREAVSYLPEKGLYCQRLPGRRARKGKRADTMGFYGTLKMIFYKVSTPRRASPPEGCSAQGRGGAARCLRAACMLLACRLPAEPRRSALLPHRSPSYRSERRRRDLRFLGGRLRARGDTQPFRSSSLAVAAMPPLAASCRRSSRLQRKFYHLHVLNDGFHAYLCSAS